MADYYEFRVIFSKESVNIEVYVDIPASELESNLEVDGLSNDDSLTVIYWAQDRLANENDVRIYVPNWDWEIEGLS